MLESEMHLEGYFDDLLLVLVIIEHGLPLGILFKLTGVRLVASEFTTVQRHRLAWLLTGTKLPVRIVRIYKLRGVELTFYCS